MKVKGLNKLKNNKKFPFLVYDINAELFPANFQGNFPFFSEGNGKEKTGYFVYANINGAWF